MKNIIQNSNKNENKNVEAGLVSAHGITLIALVFTIVILIILAGVAISLSLGENSIFNKAKFAKAQYLNGQENEKTEIAKYRNIIETNINTSRDELSTDWITLTPGIQYKKKNGYVTIVVDGGRDISLSTNATSSVIGILPEGFRPSINVYAPIGYGSYSSLSGRINIKSNGEITFSSATAGNFINGIVVFPVD